jgi:hypothetical protein
MKILVGLDNDGHFNAALLKNKDETLKIIKTIGDGDCFEEIIGEYGTKSLEEALTGTDDVWESFVENFLQRGTLEIVEI